MTWGWKSRHRRCTVKRQIGDQTREPSIGFRGGFWGAAGKAAAGDALPLVGDQPHRHALCGLGAQPVAPFGPAQECGTQGRRGRGAGVGSIQIFQRIVHHGLM